jgi:hypothetical protein
MLTFLASFLIRVTVVGALVSWAKHEERRRSALADGLESDRQGSRRS